MLASITEKIEYRNGSPSNKKKKKHYLVRLSTNVKATSGKNERKNK